jgi:hypothetical protein
MRSPATTTTGSGGARATGRTLITTNHSIPVENRGKEGKGGKGGEGGKGGKGGKGVTHDSVPQLSDISGVGDSYNIWSLDALCDVVTMVLVCAHLFACPFTKVQV